VGWNLVGRASTRGGGGLESPPPLATKLSTKTEGGGHHPIEMVLPHAIGKEKGESAGAYNPA